MPPIKTQLQSQLDEILASNQTHFEDNDLIRAVQSLKTEVDTHYQLNDRGMMRPLFAAARDQLSNQYLNLIKIVNNTVTDQDAPAGKVEAYTKLCSILQKDLAQLSAMQPDGVHSLAELVEEQNQVVTISDSELSTEGGALSSRILVSVKQNGQETPGFFTKADYLTEVKPVLDYVGQVKQLEPKLAGLIDELFNDKSISDKIYLIRIGDLLNTIMDGTTEYAEECLLFKHPEAKNWSDEKILKALECLQVIAAPFDKKTMVRVTAYTGDMRIQPGARVDSRNSAMSLVANMLGQPELLARAKPLTVVYNGKAFEGTFMELAKGTDRAHISQNDPIRNCTIESYNNAQLLKSIADMQIVDYLCCNVDRHGGNLTYIVDNSNPKRPKVTGVQGIDNDLSFGVRPMGGNTSFFEGSTTFNDILVISRSMADKVLDMDADKYFHSLRGQGLEEDACEAVVRRLRKLQNVIRESEEYFADKEPDYLERGKLRVVSDNEWMDIGLEKLASTAELGNVFSRTDVFRRQVSRIPSAGSYKYAQGTVAKPLDTTQLISTLKTLLKNVNDQNPRLIRSSEQYTAMRLRLENLTEFLEATGSPLSDKDFLRVRNSLEQLRNASEDYLDYKAENDPKPSRLAQRRINAATDVKNGIDDLINRLNESYREATADEIESFNAQMKAEAQRLYNLNEDGKTAQINLNNLAKDSPKDFAREQSKAALATLKSQLTDSSKPILQQFPNADRLAAQVLMHSMVNEIQPPLNDAVLSAMCVQRLTVENALCQTPALRNLLTKSPEKFIEVLENPANRVTLASLSMKQLDTVDRNRNVIPTAAQIEAEANAPKPQGLGMK